ncbi:1-acyl-sn-glycerol-3-phosphate acyltransferase [Oceanobacter sp. 3_MG-2023]|uniref:1-acyl-sn-glycerol-3-phosphate acyltransferase n=1 Tax=Oceanobacter sp. 3_MG-2023 TaxID=3062622 RepID=UPI0027346E20|nr:1-acyl-sn-glycerol-3-phosphate acyltransferase [Oceanobacter sp. 3_MG-2023]MDP2506425.1 1-acyl-sn-glycerol-3-phosphate acyltransferase [Oceanobacter sp. 3_MG-2023]
MPDRYADIRPYQDDEVAAVLERVSQSDTLHRALLKYRLPMLPHWLREWLLPVARYLLDRQLANVNTVHDFQMWMEGWVERLLAKTTTDVVVRGLDSMPPDQGHLWISNHRDIAMDPTLINYSLYQAGWPTSRIAIGDNLLSHPDIADVMRLNKSFIVRRNITNKREKLTALQQLSGYIRYSLAQRESVWIAQREGRAKNGVDLTDKAVLKMLALNGREHKETFAETLSALRPVPVCIQYEWDPCDLMKARELVARAKYGSYSKEEGEDTRSLLTGIVGQKGTIHVDFGQPLSDDDLASAETMAAAIDRQIRDMTEILPVHHAAVRLLQQRFSCYLQARAGDSSRQIQDTLWQRIEGEAQDVQKQVLTGYAMPILLQQNMADG